MEPIQICNCMFIFIVSTVLVTVVFVVDVEVVGHMLARTTKKRIKTLI